MGIAQNYLKKKRIFYTIGRTSWMVGWSTAGFRNVDFY